MHHVAQVIYVFPAIHEVVQLRVALDNSLARARLHTLVHSLEVLVVHRLNKVRTTQASIMIYFLGHTDVATVWSATLLGDRDSGRFLALNLLHELLNLFLCFDSFLPSLMKLRRVLTDSLLQDLGPCHWN